MCLPFFLVASVVIVPAARLRTTWKRVSGQKPAVLWGPNPIINIKWNSQAIRLLGYTTRTLTYGYFRTINRPEDFDIVINGPVKRLFLPYAVFLWAILNFDIFHVFFDCGYLAYTPMRYLEFPLMKLAGKKLIASPYGADVIRPGKLKRGIDLDAGEMVWERYPQSGRRIERDLAYTNEYADYIIGAAGLAEFLPRVDECLPVLAFDLRSWQPVFETGNAVPRLVHAPNHRTLKGTDSFIRACETLTNEGTQLELVLVEGQKNDKALEIYSQADIVLDQLLMGSYGLFAVEAMALGKPVICDMRDDLRKTLPFFEECPIVSATPDTVESVLRDLMAHPERWPEIGREGRRFVERYHSLESMGRQFERIYRLLWSRA